MFLLLFLLLSGDGVPGSAATQVKKSTNSALADYVNTFVGTGEVSTPYGHDQGDTFPGAALPFGMIQWSPETPRGFDKTHAASYLYADDQIRGFSLNHISGPGCPMMGNFPIMPFSGSVTALPAADGTAYAAKFSHAEEKTSPGFYSVALDGGTQVDLTVTARAGIGKFTFPASAPASLLFKVGQAATPVSDASLEITGDRTISGSVSTSGVCWIKEGKYKAYFAAEFNRPFSGFGTWSGTTLNRGQRSVAGPQNGGFVEFNTGKNQTVIMKVALSYVSVENARMNLRKEIPGWSFGAVRAAAQKSWNRDLGLIEVRGGTDDEKRVFYTALYHALLEPNVFNDVDGQYIGFDDQIHTAKGFSFYANFSGWDIYRCEVQLLALLFPKEASDMVKSLVLDAQQGGGLPVWPLANDEVCAMVGSPSPVMITEAHGFGARDFDTQAALAAMLKSAADPNGHSKSCKEWDNLDDYLKFGYLGPDTPDRLGRRNGTGPSHSLEFNAADFSIAEFAQAIGDTNTYRTFMKRAQFWRNLFDPQTGYIEPRKKDGSFIRVDPAAPKFYIEGNATQYTWMVPYDMRGLSDLMGGNAKMVERLDRFFTELNAGPSKPYFWIGNEPVFSVPWAYDFAGAPWGAQSVTRRVETELFTPGPDGEPGNDDLGATSAWYVFATLGIYPAIPGVGGVALNSPLFPQAKIHLANGKTIEIYGENASAQNPYVQSLAVNGQASEKTWLTYDLLSQGATLQFKLGNTPNKQWGTKPEDSPPSFSGSLSESGGDHQGK